MPSEVIFPRVDMDMAMGRISRWFVRAGDKVEKGKPLFEIETDKAAMEIEAEASGTIDELAPASGQEVPVGSVIAWIYADGEAAGAHHRDPIPRETKPQATARELHAAAARPPSGTEEAGLRPRATPLARRLARRHGLDLAALTGSGPRGRVQADDVHPAQTARSVEPSRPSSLPAESGAAAHPVRLPAEADRHVPSSGTASLATPAARAGQLHLVRLREGSGTPLLALHGFGADADSWRPFFSGQRLTRPVYALDLPGHGKSASATVTSFPALVDAVESVLVQTDLQSLHLVGHSLGAAVVAALAARGSRDIRSVLMLSPAGLGPEINGDYLGGFLAAKSEIALTPWMHQLVVDPATISPAFVRTTLQARGSHAVLEGMRRVSEVLFPDGTQSFSIRAELARLPMPARVVFGLADRIVPARQTRGLPGAIALHLYAAVGHMPQFEIREAVATILEQTTGV